MYRRYTCSTVLAASVMVLISFQATAQLLYFTDAGAIKVGDISGFGPITTLFDASEAGAGFLTLDTDNSKLYFDCGLGICVGNSDGSGTPVVLFDDSDGLFSPTGVAIDVAANKIYWVDYWLKLIQVGNLDGSGSPTTLYTLSTFVCSDCNPYDLAIDAANGKLYWSVDDNDGQPGAIQRGNTDGSGSPVTLYDFLDGLGNTLELAIDLDNGRIYWADAQQEIMRANVDGSSPTPTTMIFDEDPPVLACAGLVVDGNSGKLYFSDAATGTIQVMPTTPFGTAVTLFDSSEGLTAPGDIALDTSAAPQLPAGNCTALIVMVLLLALSSAAILYRRRCMPPAR